MKGRTSRSSSSLKRAAVWGSRSNELAVARSVRTTSIAFLTAAFTRSLYLWASSLIHETWLLKLVRMRLSVVINCSGMVSVSVI
jgi:hypothetical protein